LSGGTGVLVSSTGFVVPTWSSGAGLSFGGWVWAAPGAATDMSFVSLVGTGAAAGAALLMTYRSTNVLTFSVVGGVTLTAVRAVPVGTWNHVAVTVSGGSVSTAAVYTMYVNGVVAGGPTSAAWPTAGSYTVRVGNGTQGMTGYVDEVRVYGRTLSALEVRQVWNLGASSTAYAVVDPTGMVMYYPFNMGSMY